MRKMVVILLVVALVTVFALPAWASVYKFGSKYCYTNLVGIRSYSSGTTTHFVLEPSYYETGSWNNGSSLVHRTSFTSYYNVPSWGVEVSGGALDDDGTYGYCTGIS